VVTVIRRVQAAAAVTGLAVMLSGMAADLVPLPSEWWFSGWEIQQQVWPLTEGGGVTVAVLDSGVQASVPDLRGVVLPGGDTTGHHTNGETDFDVTQDGHGTMMSVFIAGQGYGTGMAGVAPQAKILPILVNPGTGGIGGTAGTIAAGIDYAVDHGADVINISQGAPAPSTSACDPQEQAAVAFALQHGVVIVAGAGDTGNTANEPDQPASCAGVLAVAGIGPDGSLWPGSQRQPYVTVAAPGASMVSSGLDGRLYSGGAGTSASSALVSGAVALIRSRYPSMPWQQVIQRLIGTALPVGGQVPNTSFGYGIVRLDRAVNAAAFPVPASTPDPVYARYQAWLATPQGQTISRRLAGIPSTRAAPTATGQPAAAVSSSAVSPPAGSGGSSTGTVILVLVVLFILVAVGGVATTTARDRSQQRRSRHRDGNSIFGPVIPPPQDNPGDRAPNSRPPDERGSFDPGPRRTQYRRPPT
jgi:subtilisin family serine protease